MQFWLGALALAYRSLWRLHSRLQKQAGCKYLITGRAGVLKELQEQEVALETESC